MLDILNLIIIIIIFLLVLYFIINKNKEDFYFDKNNINSLDSKSNCDKITISTNNYKEDENYKNIKLLKYKNFIFLLKEHNNSQKLYEINEDNQISPKKLYLAMKFVNYKVISHNEHLYVLNLGNNEIKVYSNYDFQNEIKTFKIHQPLQNNKIKDFYIYDDDDYNFNIDEVYIYFITTKDVYKEKLSHTLNSNHDMLLNKKSSKVHDLNLLKSHLKINLINYEKILANNEVIIIWNKYEKHAKQIKNTIIVIIDQKINLYGYNIFKHTKKTLNMNLNNLVNIKIHNKHLYLLKNNGSISIINYNNNTFIDNHILINSNIKYKDLIFFNKDLFVLSNEHILKLKECVIEEEPEEPIETYPNIDDDDEDQDEDKNLKFDLEPNQVLNERIKHNYESEYNINFINYKKLIEKGMASKAEYKIKYYTPNIYSKNYDSNKSKYNNSCFFSGYSMIDSNNINNNNNTNGSCDNLYSKY